MWIPLGVDSRVVERRGNTFLQAIARRKPGRTHAKVLREVNALFKTLARDYPQFYSASQEAVVKPLVEYWTGSARHHLWIMFSAALVLLITSTISAGSLLLSRMMMRRPEFATRLALGAGHRQIFLQLAAEGSLDVVES